ncbi:hypothetical protein Pmgp_02133 [Pelotomaculum propionicicum]|uniref:Uncharacterized protein n=1 Tax=Pelotomaculum propionicicum TaxID=258475 RepID=A0A4Y7RPT5_9FIRM|nr:hypothetical protein Pmgp_02133 [Pelotomaculum propionicicum]
MCDCECQHPEKKIDKKKCSNEQIKECHGDDKNHPCDSQDKKYSLYLKRKAVFLCKIAFDYCFLFCANIFQ